MDAALSLRTPTRAEFDIGFGALLPLLRASTVDDVADALRRWVEPVNSVLVADAAGRTLQLVAGRVPLRRPLCRRLPVPGAGRTVRVACRLRGHAERRGRRRRGHRERPAPGHRAAGNRLRAATPGAPDPGPDRRRRAAPDDPHGHRWVGGPALSRGASITRSASRTWDGRMDADSATAGAYAAWRAGLVRPCSWRFRRCGRSPRRPGTTRCSRRGWTRRPGSASRSTPCCPNCPAAASTSRWTGRPRRIGGRPRPGEADRWG